MSALGEAVIGHQDTANGWAAKLCSYISCDRTVQTHVERYTGYRLPLETIARIRREVNTVPRKDRRSLKPDKRREGWCDERAGNRMIDDAWIGTSKLAAALAA